jgi:hypothetical protein
MATYQIILNVHNINRWMVLLLLVVAVVNSLIGRSTQTFTQKDSSIQRVLLYDVYLQVALGLILFFVSPLITEAFKIGIFNAINVHEMRFFVVEHPLVMLISVMLVKVGFDLSAKQTTARAKHNKAAVFFGIALLVIITRIPWHRLWWPA